MSYPTWELLEGVLARLKAGLPDLEVDWWPDQAPTAGRRLVPGAGAVWVGYGGTRWSGPASSAGPWQNTDALAQRRQVVVVLLVQVATLRSEVGLVAVLDRLRALLLGWTPPHGSPLRGLEERFLDSANGLWSWEATWTTETLVVADREPAPGPRLSQVTVADDYLTAHIIRRDAATGAIITEYQDP
jgi:hypothetical protein